MVQLGAVHMDHVPSVGENATQKRIAGSKIAYTVHEAVQASGFSRSSLYVAIGNGTRRAHKHGARTLILDSDLRRFLRRLPLTKISGAGA